VTDQLHTELPAALRRALDLLSDPPAKPDISNGYLDLLTDDLSKGTTTTPRRWRAGWPAYGGCPSIG
jgi:arsenite methyltransferase